MILNYEFLIPKKTPESTPIKSIYDMGVNARFIRNVQVIIPEGHKGLAFCRISTPGYVIVPAQGSNVNYIRGDNTVINARELNIPVQGVPYNLYVEGYNLDDYLSHSFLINVEV